MSALRRQNYCPHFMAEKLSWSDTEVRPGSPGAMAAQGHCLFPSPSWGQAGHFEESAAQPVRSTGTVFSTLSSPLDLSFCLWSSSPPVPGAHSSVEIACVQSVLFKVPAWHWMVAHELSLLPFLSYTDPPSLPSPCTLLLMALRNEITSSFLHIEKRGQILSKQVELPYVMCLKGRDGDGISLGQGYFNNIQHLHRLWHG